jgi:Tol biopolymer transport system component
MPDLLTLAALRALVSFSDPEFSPDGTRIAYVRSTAGYASDKRHAALVVVRVDGTGSRIVVEGEGIAAPRWSPDGTLVAFVRPDKNDKTQIDVVPAGGGKPRAITQTPDGVQHFAWSPDGRRFVFDTPDPDPNAAAIKRHDDLFEIGDDGMFIESVAVPSHLWLVAASGGPAHRLTHGSWSVYQECGAVLHP